MMEMWEASGVIAKLTLVTLIIMSAWSIGVMIDRLLAFSAARKQSREFAPLVKLEELDKHFVDFMPFLGKCRFKGCSHRHEPQCIIKEAVTDNKITEKRYFSYCSIYDSL